MDMGKIGRLGIILAVAGILGVGGYALAHGPGERHEVDRNSPSDLMMEQCTQTGLGPEGHTQVGRMIDEMHGEGAHHRLHEFMDGMIRGMSSMMGGQVTGRGMMGNGMMGPGMVGPAMMGPGRMSGPGI